jgi:hypothetical protein
MADIEKDGGSPAAPRVTIAQADVTADRTPRVRRGSISSVRRGSMSMGIGAPRRSYDAGTVPIDYRTL